jgi:hypothetical protein
MLYYVDESIASMVTDCGLFVKSMPQGSPPLGERVYVDVHDSAKQSLDAARGHVGEPI